MTVRTPVGNLSSAPGNFPRRFNKREKKLIESIQKDTNTEVYFKNQPKTSYTALNASGAVAVVPAEAVQGFELFLECDGVDFQEHLSAVESTGTALYNWPYASASGLEVPLLAANGSDGITSCELTNGILATCPSAYTVGSFLEDKIFFECKVLIDDISDLGQLFVGFRKAEAYQADPDAYDELAAFHVGETGATVADGQINIAVILNDAATSYTDTTLTDWANDGHHTLRVEVSNNGICQFFYDGAVPTVTKSFTFDAAEVLVPFMFLETIAGSTNGDPGVSITHWKCGYV